MCLEESSRGGRVQKNPEASLGAFGCLNQVCKDARWVREFCLNLPIRGLEAVVGGKELGQQQPPSPYARDID